MPSRSVLEWILEIQRITLTRHEFLGGIDAAQLQDGVAHGGFQQHGQVTASGHGQHQTAHRHTEYILRFIVQRQTQRLVLQGSA